MRRRNFIYALGSRVGHIKNTIRFFDATAGFQNYQGQLFYKAITLVSCDLSLYGVIPATAVMDINFLRKRSEHLLHERGTILPEEVQLKRARFNKYLLQEYSKLIINIRERGLPWDAEQRKESLKKLLELDTNYLENHLKPIKDPDYPDYSDCSDYSEYSDYSDNYSDSDELNVNTKKVRRNLRTLSSIIRNLKILMTLEPNEHDDKYLLYQQLHS